MQRKIITWLLTQPAHIQYRTKIDLLHQNSSDTDLIQLRKKMSNQPEIKLLLNEIQQWPGIPLKRHNDAKHLIHKLAFLADLGFTMDDKEIQPVVNKIVSHQSPDGPFEIIMNIPVHFGGSGTDEFFWMLCDAPLVIYSLVKFGLLEDQTVLQAVDHLESLISENGWHCKSDSRVKKFRGPGRKDDPCPYANLLMLKLLSLFPEKYNKSQCKLGVETILQLWKKRKEVKPYLFAMGTDFQKLKTPLIWYDILHVTEVLSHFPYTWNDQRFLEMIEIIKQKQDSEGRFTAESIWTAWKTWDFGQKKQPSAWITLLIHKILERISSNKQ